MTRTPEGRFISQDAMLAAWLPKMLDWARSGSLMVMLNVASHWCDLRAGGEYLDAGRALSGEPDGDWAQRYALRRGEDAARWFARKAILQRAKAELEAIR
jgi:hypothetical protein